MYLGARFKALPFPVFKIAHTQFDKECDSQDHGQGRKDNTVHHGLDLGSGILPGLLHRAGHIAAGGHGRNGEEQNQQKDNQHGPGIPFDHVHL